MSDLERQTIDTVKKVAPAVVSIVISKLLSQMKDLPKARTFKPKEHFPLPLDEKVNADPNTRVRIGGGSGFFVSSDGMILTNKHVVFETDAEYSVVTNDEREFSAQILTRDPINDVAILKINIESTSFLPLGDSSSIELGQTAIAVGNALGLFSNTVSKGIISGLGRKVSAALGDGSVTEHLRHVIQTDVAINQGNSGGPLVNLDGQVIGINTAVIFGAQNIGFAIPINWAKSDIKDLMEHGRIIRPYLGARYIMINKELKQRYHLPVDAGALIIRDHLPNSVAVIPNSPAEKAGLIENDVVIEINDQKLSEDQELADIVDLCSVGDEITLSILRNGEMKVCKATLDERK